MLNIKPSLLLFCILFVGCPGERHIRLPDIGAQQQARVRGDLTAITNGLRVYRSQVGEYPTTEQGISAFVERPVLEPIPEKWFKLIEEIPTDAWGRRYVYRVPGADGAEFDLFSLGPDGIESDDDIRNVSTRPDAHPKT